MVWCQQGALILDDTTLDKPHARHMGLVTWHWSGKHQRVVQGINLISLVWTDGEALLPETIVASTTALPPPSVAIQTPRSRSAGSYVACQSRAPAALNFLMTR